MSTGCMTRGEVGDSRLGERLMLTFLMMREADMRSVEPITGDERNGERKVEERGL